MSPSIVRIIRAIALLLLAAGWPAAVCADAARPSETVTLYVARRGWHIDVGVSSADLGPELAPVKAAFPRARYLFFGFGDRRYLLSKHHYAPATLAALWPGRGMLLVTALGASPQEAFGADQVIALTLARSELENAIRFVAASLVDPRTAYSPGPYPASAYFESTAKYSAIHTCNTWAAQVLRAGGVPIHSRGVILAGQLWRQLRRVRNFTQLQGGADPSWHTTVVVELGGTTTVVFAGGAGLLLLMHPASKQAPIAA